MANLYLDRVASHNKNRDNIVLGIPRTEQPKSSGTPLLPNSPMQGVKGVGPAPKQATAPEQPKQEWEDSQFMRTWNHLEKNDPYFPEFVKQGHKAAGPMADAVNKGWTTNELATEDITKAIQTNAKQAQSTEEGTDTNQDNNPYYQFSPQRARQQQRQQAQQQGEGQSHYGDVGRVASKQRIDERKANIGPDEHTSDQYDIPANPYNLNNPDEMYTPGKFGEDAYTATITNPMRGLHNAVVSPAKAAYANYKDGVNQERRKEGIAKENLTGSSLNSPQGFGTAAATNEQLANAGAQPTQPMQEAELAGPPSPNLEGPPERQGALTPPQPVTQQQPVPTGPALTTVGKDEVINKISKEGAKDIESVPSAPEKSTGPVQSDDINNVRKKSAYDGTGFDGPMQSMEDQIAESLKAPGKEKAENTTLVQSLMSDHAKSEARNYNPPKNFWGDNHFMSAMTSFFLGALTYGADLQQVFANAASTYDNLQAQDVRTSQANRLLKTHSYEAVDAWVRTGKNEFLEKGKLQTDSDRRMAAAKLLEIESKAERERLGIYQDKADVVKTRLENEVSNYDLQTKLASGTPEQAAAKAEELRKLSTNKTQSEIDLNYAKVQDYKDKAAAALQKVQNGSPLKPTDINHLRKSLSEGRVALSNLYLHPSMVEGEKGDQRFSVRAATWGLGHRELKNKNNVFEQNQLNNMLDANGNADFSKFKLSKPAGALFMRTAPKSLKRAGAEWLSSIGSDPNATDAEKTLAATYTHASDFLTSLATMQNVSYNQDFMIEHYGKYFPEMGDSSKTIAQKSVMRSMVAEFADKAAGRQGTQINSEAQSNMYFDLMEEVSKGAETLYYDNDTKTTMFVVDEGIGKGLGLPKQSDGRYHVSMDQLSEDAVSKMNDLSYTGLSRREISEVLTNQNKYNMDALINKGKKAKASYDAESEVLDIADNELTRHTLKSIGLYQ